MRSRAVRAAGCALATVALAAASCQGGSGRPGSQQTARGPDEAGVVQPQAGPSGVRATFRRVVSGLNNPVFVTSARDGSGRLFVVQQGGTVRVVKNGRVQAGSYLDVRGRISSGGERGLLSMAFHPNFAKHPTVFAAYTRGDGALQVVRFKVRRPGASHVIASSMVRLLAVPHAEQSNHNAGQLMFGRGGLLFITTGDGGGGGDPYRRAENLRSLSGKILRIDVDRSCGRRHYCSPSSNPFAGSSTRRHEIFDWGLRNPWRASVDRADGRLWIADVGQDVVEEVDHVRARGGRDFGWSCKEGFRTYNSSRCAGRHLTAPVFTYQHDVSGKPHRCAVIGGYAYRGPQYPFAHGLYISGDYCSGELWATKQLKDGSHRTAAIGDMGSSLTAFGEGDHGEIYAVDQGGHLSHVVWHRR
jgi:glucose/arabinose dehydrogenase